MDLTDRSGAGCRSIAITLIRWVLSGKGMFSTNSARQSVIISLMKKRKGFPQKRAHTKSWLGNKFRPGFRGYPIATVAFYGPNNRLATKLVVSVILTENNQPDFLKRWFSEGDLDVRRDPVVITTVIMLQAKVVSMMPRLGEVDVHRLMFSR
jgi:hypothetical protein